MNIPKKYMNLVGTKQIMGGGLFSYKRAEPKLEYDVLNIRGGMATIVSLKQIREKGESDYEYPTFELLIKRDGMRSARWTRPFPIPEINLKKKRKQSTIANKTE